MKTPQLPPLIIKKSPSAFYVYTYKNKWDPEKEKLPRQLQESRHCHLRRERGKNPMGWPFFSWAPGIEGLYLWTQGKDYVFTPMNEGGFTLSGNGSQTTARGSYLGTGSARCSISHWRSSQNSHYSILRDYLKVLSIAYFIILNQDNNISRYPTFAEATRLPWGAPLHPSSIGRIFINVLDP